MQIKEYLNKICEQIKYKPVREEISKEIEDHINDIKEDLIKDGANETTAEIKAINQMGNAEEIGRKLNKIHKPKLDWKLLIITFVLICFGFVVSFIKTTSDIAETNNLNFMTRFILFTLFGIVLGIGVYFSNYKKVQKYSYLLFIISSSIIIYAILFGFLVNGIPYIRIGTRFFSASVIAIPLYIISFAGFLMEKNIKNSIEIKIGNEKFKIKYNIIKLVFLSMISIFLLLMIPSKASAIVLTLNCMFILESIFNILMNLNLWIEADFNIPFISYGGLNMIVNLVSLGFVLSVYRKKDIYMYEGNAENIEKISKNC